MSCCGQWLMNPATKKEARRSQQNLEASMSLSSEPTYNQHLAMLTELPKGKDHKGKSGPPSLPHPSRHAGTAHTHIRTHTQACTNPHICTIGTY